MRMRLGLTFAVGAAVVAFAGCGGDDEAPVEPVGPTTSTDATASAEEFISTADARCAEANSAIASLAGTAGTPELAASQEREITQGTLASINSLPQPEDPDGALAEFLDALKAQVATLKQQEQAAQSGDTASFDSLSGQLAQDKADTLAAAKQFGFEECGREGTAASTTPTTETPAPDTATSTTPPAATTTTVAPAPVEPAPAPAPPPADTSGGTGTDDGSSGGSGGGGSSSGGIGAG